MNFPHPSLLFINLLYDQMRSNTSCFVLCFFLSSLFTWRSDGVVQRLYYLVILMVPSIMKNVFSFLSLTNHHIHFFCATSWLYLKERLEEHF